MSIEAGAARSWLNMLSLFAEQLFRPGSLLNHPLAGWPFVDSLVRGLLLAADNPYRRAIAGERMRSALAVSASRSKSSKRKHICL